MVVAVNKAGVRMRLDVVSIALEGVMVPIVVAVEVGEPGERWAMLMARLRTAANPEFF